MPKPNVYVVSVKEVLSNKHYTIPQYQRSFAWGKEEASLLYDDLIGLKQVHQHYLGQIIIKKDETFSEEVFEVIDGQQRLTAISLMIIAIRDVMKKVDTTNIDKNILEELSDNISLIKELTEIKRNSFKKSFNNGSSGILRLQERDNKFFQDILSRVDVFKQKNKNENIVIVFKKFNDLINDSLEKWTNNEDKVNFLNDSIINLSRNFYIAAIEADTKDNAHSMFESLNNRGVQLESIDLIKNYLVMILDGDENDSYRKYWHCYDNDNAYEIWRDKSVMKKSDSVLSDMFYSYIQQFGYTGKGSKSKLYKDFIFCVNYVAKKDGITNKEALIKVIRIFREINDSKMSHLYSMVKNKNNPGPIIKKEDRRKDWEKSIEVRIEDFIDRTNDNTDSWIVLYWFLVNRKNFLNSKINSQQDFLEIIDIIEIYIIRKKVATQIKHTNLSSNLLDIINEMNSSIENNINVKTALIESLFKKKASRTAAVPTRREVEKAFESNSFTPVLAKTILYAIEETNNSNRKVINRISRKSDAYHLEHIKPKISESKEENGDLLLIQNIGNFILLTGETNTSIKDMIFYSSDPSQKSKLKEYEKESLWIVNDFLKKNGSKTEWSEKEIQNRSKNLYDYFIKIWDYEQYEKEIAPERKTVLISQSIKQNNIENIGLNETESVFFKKDGAIEEAFVRVNDDNRYALFFEDAEYTSLEQFFKVVLGTAPRSNSYKQLYLDEKCEKSIQSVLGISID